jgi:hypothetical protein
LTVGKLLGKFFLREIPKVAGARELLRDEQLGLPLNHYQNLVAAFKKMHT